MAIFKTYAKLRGRIREKFGGQAAFAVALGMHPTTLSLKLCGHVDWAREEIERACRLLDIPLEEAHEYFF